MAQHDTVLRKIIEMAVLLLPAIQFTFGSRNGENFPVMMAAKVQ